MPEPTETTPNAISPEIQEWVSGIDRIGGDVNVIREEVRSAINQALIAAKVSPDELKSKKQMLYNRSTQSTYVQLNYTADRESDFKAVFEDVNSGALPERLAAGLNARIRDVMTRFPSQAASSSAPDVGPSAAPESQPTDNENETDASGNTTVPAITHEAPLSRWGKFTKFFSRLAFWKKHGEHDNHAHAAAHGHGKEHWAVSTVKWPFRKIDQFAGFANKFFELPVIRAFVYGNEHYILRTKSKKSGGHGDSHGH